jgi:hypothetical protein
MKSTTLTTHLLRKSAMALLAAGTALLLATHSPKVVAQSEASLVLSALPIASVVVAGAGASAAAGAVIAVPVVLSTAGAVLVVKTIESTARGTVYVLERASDGARASIELTGKAVGGASMVAGSVVTVSVISAGVILSAVGEAIAFIPNELGRALLHNERLTK